MSTKDATYEITVERTVTYWTDTDRTEATITRSLKYTINVFEACVAESINLTTNLPDPLEYTLGDFGSNHNFSVDFTTNIGCSPTVIFSFDFGDPKPNMLTIPDPLVAQARFD